MADAISNELPAAAKRWAIEGCRKAADGTLSWLVSEGTNSHGDGPARYVGYFECSQSDAVQIVVMHNLALDDTSAKGSV